MRSLVPVALAVLASAASAYTQPSVPSQPDLWAVPDHAIAWLAFDPAALALPAGAPARRVIEQGLAAAAEVLLPGAADDLRPLLDAPRNGPGPYRVALLSLEAAQPATRARPAKPAVSALAALLDLRGGAPEAIGAGPDLRIHAEEGRVLAACERGVTGTIDRWLQQERVRRDAAEPWHIHRARASESAGVPSGVRRGTTVLEAYIDLNALRRAAPDWFSGTRTHRLLREWRLINARAVMLHAHLVPAAAVRAKESYAGAPLLAVELTWSVRSEPRDVVRAKAISTATWPENAPELGLSSQRGDWALLASAEWGTWLRAVMGTYRNAGTEFEGMTRTNTIVGWDKKHGSAAVALIAASTGWALAWMPPRDASGEPRGLMILAPIKPDADQPSVQQNLARVSGTIHPRIVFEEQRQSWVAPLPDVGLDLTWMYAGGGREPAVLAELRPRPDP